MRQKQNAVLTSLRQVQQFLDLHSDVLTAVNVVTRKELDDLVDQLSTLSVDQENGTHGSKGETAQQAALRVSLRRTYMAPIAQLARHKLRDVPGFAALTLPPVNASTERLVASAISMADMASQHSQTLIDNGLPATFVDDLRTAAAALVSSVSARANQQIRRSTATAGLADQERRGRSLLRVLNALVVATIGNDADLLGGWSTAKLVRKKPGPTTRSGTAVPTPIHKTPVVVTPMPAPAATLTSATSPVGVAA